MKALRILIYSALCRWPGIHLQSNKTYNTHYISDFSRPHNHQSQFSNLVALPLPKCLQTKASPRIICPHRSMQPQPVSEVGPVPPVTLLPLTNQTKQIYLSVRIIKCSLWTVRIGLMTSLTNWLKVLSVREPQTWGDVCQNIIFLWDTKNIVLPTRTKHSSTKPSMSTNLLPVRALNCFPKIQTGSEVSGKSSISPKRNESYVRVAVGGKANDQLEAKPLTQTNRYIKNYL